MPLDIGTAIQVAQAEQELASLTMQLAQLRVQELQAQKAIHDVAKARITNQERQADLRKVIETLTGAGEA